MKTKLYARWVKLVLKQFPKHTILKQDGGKYLLACRIWNYNKLYPKANSWVSEIPIEFKRKYSKK